VGVDRFGNEYKVVGCKDKKGKGFSAGYVEIRKPGLYKLEPSQSQKEGVEHWIRVTKVQQNRQGNGNGSFGGGRRGGGGF
jgi:hypothetical protein